MVMAMDSPVGDEVLGLVRRQSEAVRKLDVWWRSTRVVMSAEEAHEVADRLLGVLVGNAELCEEAVLRAVRRRVGER